MNKAIGILFGNGGSDSLQGLTSHRPIAAIPFGGRYRLLDFALSSMVNSGIRTIGLITPHHYKAMLDHLGAGKAWFLERKAGGLFILPGTIHGLMGQNVQFRLKDMALNLEYLQKDLVENVVVSSCNQVFNINYRDALAFHESNQADITLIYKELDCPPQKEKRIRLVMGDGPQVTDLQDSFRIVSGGQEQPYFVNMLIIRRQLLLDIVDGYQSMENIDLLDAIAENIQTLKVFGFAFEGYVGMINSVQDYFERNMDLLDTAVREKLLLGFDRIHTKFVDNPPTQHGMQARVSNSLIASGCLIEGEVENSIISRGVIIERGAQIKNCLIMQKCTIGAHTMLEHVILDKFVEIHNGNVLKGRRNSPMVVLKRAMV